MKIFLPPKATDPTTPFLVPFSPPLTDSAVLMPILKQYPAEEMALRWGMGPRFMESSHRQATDDIRI
jgi:hypothetical protein